MGSVLISTTTAPLFRAACANDAAGQTIPDVPIEKKTSDAREALTAASNSALGNDSPKNIGA